MEQKKTWIAPDVDPESNLEKDLRAETVSAPRRLALYITNRLASVKESVAVELLKAGVDPVGAYIVMGIDEDTVKYTRSEAAILYDEFLKAIAALQVKSSWDGKPLSKSEDELTINWSVDYGPDRDFYEILHAANVAITANRAATGGPKTPKSWGVGMKCSYYASDGCAKFQKYVIDNKGCLMEENPWETFLKSGLPSDEVIAKQLQPKIPQDIEKRFVNCSIVQKMGYTFEKDAVLLARTANWGVVSELIETVKSDVPQKEGFKVLREAGRRYGNGIQWSIIKQLSNAGLPLLEKKSYYEDEALFNIFEDPDDFKLSNFLEEFPAPKCGDYGHGDMLRKYAWAITTRYRGRSFEKHDTQLFEDIVRFWVKMRLREDEDLYKKGSDWQKRQKLELLGHLEAEKDRSWSESFITHIQKCISNA